MAVAWRSLSSHPRAACTQDLGSSWPPPCQARSINVGPRVTERRGQRLDIRWRSDRVAPPADQQRRDRRQISLRWPIEDRHWGSQHSRAQQIRRYQQQGCGDVGAVGETHRDDRAVNELMTVLCRDDERPEVAGAVDDLVLIEGEWVRRAVARRDAPEDEAASNAYENPFSAPTFTRCPHHRDVALCGSLVLGSPSPRDPAASGLAAPPGSGCDRAPARAAAAVVPPAAAAARPW